MAMNNLKRADEVEITMDELAIMIGKGFAGMQERMNDMKMRLEARLDVIEARLTAVESRLDKLEKKLDAISARNDYIMINYATRKEVGLV